jgi:ATP-dependent RNA helicase DDX51/DBP6
MVSFGGARFDPSAPELTEQKSSNTASKPQRSNAGEGSTNRAAGENLKPAVANISTTSKPAWGHLSGAQRRARARARETGQKWSPGPAGPAQHTRKERPISKQENTATDNGGGVGSKRKRNELAQAHADDEAYVSCSSGLCGFAASSVCNTLQRQVLESTVNSHELMGMLPSKISPPAPVGKLESVENAADIVTETGAEAGKKKKEKKEKEKKQKKEQKEKKKVRKKKTKEVEPEEQPEYGRKRTKLVNDIKRKAADAISLAEARPNVATEDSKTVVEVDALDIGQLQSRLEAATDSRPALPETNNRDTLSSDQGLPAWLEKTELIQLPGHVDIETGKAESLPVKSTTLQDIGVAECLCKAAHERLGVTTLFLAQASAIPAIMQHTGDVLVSAPTGSGKTLVYAMPVLNDLLSRIVPRLRAVILLPTRDLALQVLHIFETLIDGAGLQLSAIGLMGKVGLKQEQKMIAKSKPQPDIVVATPGRLVTHLTQTPDFNLAALQWLVIDDADRLLQQSYQDWVSEVMNSIEQSAALAREDRQTMPQGLSLCNWVVLSDPALLDAQVSARVTGVRKLVLSATLTQVCPHVEFATHSIRVDITVHCVSNSILCVYAQNPAKLFSLQLNRPLSLHASEDRVGRFVLPSKLLEEAMVIPDGLKPLAVVQLLTSAARQDEKQNFPPTIVFASTVDATHRLFRLLQLFGKFRVAEYSSRLPSGRRKEILHELQNQQLDVVVCSDVMTRGIDVAAVRLVINYDAPSHVKTYVHRVGRTARAGKSGRAVTLLRREDVRFFRELRKKAMLPELVPQAGAVFREMLAKEDGLEKRYSKCGTT